LVVKAVPGAVEGRFRGRFISIAETHDFLEHKE
jgi:hypothetical protein